MEDTTCRQDNAPEIDALVMGSLFMELTPAQAGRPLLEMETLIPTASGAAANSAAALAALGIQAGILARVGADELGQWLVRQMHEKGIDTSAVIATDDQLTPLSVASADLRGGKRFLFYRFPRLCDPLAALALTELSPQAITRARLFDFTEAVVRSPKVRQVAFQAARWAQEAGRQVVYAVNYRAEAWSGSVEQMRTVQREAIALAGVVMMNEEEYQLIYPQENADNLRQLRPELGDRILLVTAGEEGGYLYYQGEVRPFAAYDVEVQYDVGAGDSFHAGFVAAYLEGKNVQQAAQFAAACAALKISRPASSPPPTRDEVLLFMAAAE